MTPSSGSTGAKPFRVKRRLGPPCGDVAPCNSGKHRTEKGVRTHAITPEIIAAAPPASDVDGTRLTGLDNFCWTHVYLWQDLDNEGAFQ